MANKPGRNDACICGSGKKYKKCCAAAVVAPISWVDFGWQKIRQLEGAVFDQHLVPYLLKVLSSDVLAEAEAAFFPENFPEEIYNDLMYNTFFLPWALFHWTPAPFGSFGVSQMDDEQTIVQNYKALHRAKLNSAEKCFIDAMDKTHYSFYSILDVEFEKTLLVKDVLLGTTHTIKECQGTHFLKRGDVIFSRILALDQQTIFVGMAPYVVPAHHQNNLIDFRDWLIEENHKETLNTQVLGGDLEDALFDCFFDIMRAAYQPPTVLNTDGDHIQFEKSYFHLIGMSVEEALNRLLPLTLSKDPAEFLAEAIRDASGAITKVQFPWLKKGNKKHNSWENTIFGDVTLERDQLILATNSSKRSSQGKKLLTRYLGESVRLQRTLIESMVQKLNESSNIQKQLGIDDEQLNALPEVQEKLKKMSEAHWENWFEMPIPALANQTPREAANSQAGKERLEALLLQYDRYDLERNSKTAMFKADIPFLRQQLGLGVDG